MAIAKTKSRGRPARTKRSSARRRRDTKPAQPKRPLARARRKFLLAFPGGFRDMIDMQSFLWVQGSDEYPD
jgi:hypothetical protein